MEFNSQSSSINDGGKKKRNRPSLVCVVCKKRKIKCDKGKPCSSCVRKKIESSCIYEDIPIPTRSRKRSKLNKKEKTHPSPSSSDSNQHDEYDDHDHDHDRDEDVGDHLDENEEYTGVRTSSISSSDKSRVISRTNMFDHLDSSISPVNNNNNTNADSAKASKTDSSLVLVSKAELDELRAKVQRYSLGLISPARSETSLNESSYNNQPPSGQSTAPTSIVSSPGSGHYLNKFMSQDRLMLLQCHDVTLPGLVPDKELQCRNEFYFKNKFQTDVVRKIALKDIPMPDNSPQSIAAYAVGINPYDSESDTINFYEDYDPIHIKSQDKRVSYGPLAWASIQRKDHTLSLLKRYTSSPKFKEMFAIKHQSKQPSVAPSISKEPTVAATSTLNTTSETNQNYDTKCVLVQNPAKEHQRALNLDGSQLPHFSKKILEEDDEMVPYEIKKDHQPESKEQSESEYLGVYDKKPAVLAKKTLNLNNKFIEDRVLTLGLTILDGDRLDGELKLIEQIQRLIPKRKVIWILVKRFFRLVYPYFPYIDESDFRNKLQEIIGKESVFDDAKPTVKVQKKTDFAHLGILFVVLRLAYLSLFFNKSSINETILSKTESLTPEEDERKYLLLNPINLCSIEVAQTCLHQFQLLRKLSLPILQIALYLRIYHRLAPEDGDGLDGGDSQVYNGMLIQMAYSMGLNREPTKYMTDEKTNNLCRKIWYFLCINDFTQAFTFGYPLTTNKMYYDTKAPRYGTDNFNLNDQELEKATITLFKYGEALIKGPMSNLLESILNIDKQIKMSELTELLNHFEAGVRGIFGTVHDYVNRLESTDVTYRSTKIMKTTAIISLNAFFVSIYFQLGAYYDKKKNHELSFFYLKKLTSVTIGEMIPSFLSLIIRSQENFGEGADLVINPGIIQAIQRTCEVIVISLVKYNLWIYKSCTSPDHKSKYSSDAKYRTYFDSMCLYVNVLEKCCKICLAAAMVMSGRYYYAWAITKIHGFFLKIVNGAEFYETHKDAELYFNPPTLDQLDELYKIGQISITTLGTRARRGPKRCDNPEFQELYTIDPKQKPSILKDFDDSYFYVPETVNPNYNAMPYGTDMPTAGSNFNDAGGDMPFASTTPLSDFSNGVPFDELDLDDCPEIDSVWLQMLTQKVNPNLSSIPSEFNDINMNNGNSNYASNGLNNSNSFNNNTNINFNANGNNNANVNPTPAANNTTAPAYPSLSKSEQSATPAAAANGNTATFDFNSSSFPNYQLFETAFTDIADGSFDFFTDTVDKLLN
ncbi:fungal transcriptional regulatory protein [Scheffersomyces coipomensis]|uniref:fungal transcriptional regulatory protein n=1 Tax=Scheffersomyces coipomensis TaxID=1788519 RepID=UPI00315D580D